MMRAALAIVMLPVVSVSLAAQVRLNEEQASKLLLDSPDPDFPELAKRIQMRALSRIDVVVSEKGEVTSATYLSGNPMLAEAALQAAKKRKYRALLAAGSAKAFITTVEYPGPGGLPYSSGASDNVVTKFESNGNPAIREICTGDRAYYPTKAIQGDVPMDRRERFEIRTCPIGGGAQVLAFESNKQNPTLVYTTGGSWPLQVHHVVNVLIVPLSGSAGGVLVFHFKHGVVQPVSGADTQHGIGVQVNEDGREVSLRLPHANHGPTTKILRYSIEY